MPSQIKEKLSHQSIVVKTVGKPSPFGNAGGQKLSFASEGKNYVCFLPTLFGEVTPGATLDADIEVRESGEYINNVVTQVYKDGKPMAQSKGKGIFQPHSRSPQEINSIENQVRAKIIAELWIGKVIDDKHHLAVKLERWLSELGNPDSVTKVTVDVKVSPSTLKPPKVEPPKKVEPQPEAKKLTVKDLVDISNEKGYDANNVTAIIIRQFKKAKASELSQEQIDQLYNQMKDGKFKVSDDKKKK